MQCGSGLFIPYPGSGFFHPGSKSRIEGVKKSLNPGSCRFFKAVLMFWVRYGFDLNPFGKFRIRKKSWNWLDLDPHPRHGSKTQATLCVVKNLLGHKSKILHVSFLYPAKRYVILWLLLVIIYPGRQRRITIGVSPASEDKKTGLCSSFLLC
jgi:hypothetical protein